MKTDESVQRWSARPPSGDPVEDRVSDLFRQVDVPVRFRERGPSVQAQRIRRPLARRLSTVAALVLLSGSGVVIAAKGLPQRWIDVLTAAPPAPARTAPPRPAPKPRTSQPATAQTLSPAVPVPAAPPSQPANPPVPAVVATPVPTRHAPPAASEAPRPLPVRTLALADRPAAPVEPPRLAPPPAPRAPVIPRETPTAHEARLLQAALVRLHHDGDASGALSALDRYAAQFPAGLLSKEAAMVRADSLLALGRPADALRTLDGLTLGAGTRETELRLIRAELRAKSACAAARADFDAVLRAGVADGLEERALYGRAACEARSGSAGVAERTFRRYLERFPRGRFAREAHQALDTGEGL